MTGPCVLKIIIIIRPNFNKILNFVKSCIISKTYNTGKCKQLVTVTVTVITHLVRLNFIYPCCLHLLQHRSLFTYSCLLLILHLLLFTFILRLIVVYVDIASHFRLFIIIVGVSLLLFTLFKIYQCLPSFKVCTYFCLTFTNMSVTLFCCNLLFLAETYHCLLLILLGSYHAFTIRFTLIVGFLPLFTYIFAFYL